MNRALLLLGSAYVVAIGIVLLVAACVSADRPPASPPVLTTNMVSFAAPTPPGVPQQVLQRAVVSQMVNGQAAPLVTGHSNAPRTNILIAFNHVQGQFIGVLSHPGDQRLAYLGDWLQGSTNLTNEASWTNIQYFPGTNTATNGEVGSVALRPGTLAKYFRLVPFVVLTNN